MAVTPNSFIAAQGARAVAVQFANADGTTIKDIIAGGANGSKLIALFATSTDTAAKVAQVYFYNGTAAFLAGSSALPIGAGSDGATPSVDLLGATLNPGIPFDNDGQHYALIPSGSKIQLGMLAALAAAKTVQIIAMVEDF